MSSTIKQLMSQSPLSAQKEAKTHESLVVLFVFFGLLIGAILREVNKKYKLPYALIILAAGVIWGYNRVNLGLLGDAIDGIQRIDPYGILIIFIPTLIFESAFNSDWYIFKRRLGTLIILAGPGVLMNALLAAFSLKILLGYAENDDLSWSTCLMIGAIISCSDPIAVDSFFKNIEASNKLKILIEGEALINGGTGMTLFYIFADLTRGESFNFLSFIGEVVRRMGSAPIFGLIFGLVSSLWLQKITRDSILSITISFISCYLLFFVAESLDASGILSVVTLGLFYSAYGKTKVDSEADYALHAVWPWVHFVCKTLIFLIIGSLVGYQIIYNDDSGISYADCISMIGFYIAVYLIRIIIILIFMPLVSRIGYGVAWKEVILLTFGSPRGTLSLALALMVGVDNSFPIRTRDMVVFHVFGVVIISLLINSTLGSIFIVWMSVENSPEIKKKIQRNFLAELYIQSKKRLEIIKNNKDFNNSCDWRMVQDKVGFDELLNLINKNNVNHNNELVQVSNTIERRSAYNAFQDDEIYSETRFRLLRILRGLFWEKYEICQINANTVRLLIEGCNIALDHTNIPIDMWQYFYEYFTSFKSIKFFFKIKDLFIIGRFATRFIANHLAFIYEVTTTFIKCSQELAMVQDNIPLSKDHIKAIMEELEKNIYDANYYICTLEDNFIQIIKTIQIKRASTNILLYQKQYLNQVFKHGQIDEQEHNELRKNVDRKLLELDQLKVDWQAPSFNNFVMQYPIFSCLKKNEMQAILSQSSTKEIPKGQFLYEKDSQISGLYIITKGIVKEIFIDKNSLKKSLGSILSFANLISDNDLALTTCEAITNVQANIIPMATLRYIMSQNKEFEEKCYKSAIPYLVSLYCDKNTELSKIEELNLNEFLKEGKLIKHNKINTRFKLPKGGFYFYGDVKKVIDEVSCQQIVDKTIEKYSYIPPLKEDLIVLSPSVLIGFNKTLNEFRGLKLGEHLGKAEIRSIADEIEFDKKLSREFNSLLSDNDPLVS